MSEEKIPGIRPLNRKCPHRLKFFATKRVDWFLRKLFLYRPAQNVSLVLSET